MHAQFWLYFPCIAAYSIIEQNDLSNLAVFCTVTYGHNMGRNARICATSNGGCRREEKSLKYWSLFTKLLSLAPAIFQMCSCISVIGSVSLCLLVGQLFGWSVTHSSKTSKSCIFSTVKWFLPSGSSIHKNYIKQIIEINYDRYFITKFAFKQDKLLSIFIIN